MIKSIKKMILAAAFLMVAAVNIHAQNSGEVEKVVNDMVSRYDNVDNVECLTVAKGSGLEMFKLALNQQFGKDFMKGVKSITIINYSDASEETCLAIRKELNAFLAVLEEFDVDEEKEFSDNDYIRCFGSSTDDTTISDFVIALENDESKMFMYMAGKIKVE